MSGAQALNPDESFRMHFETFLQAGRLDFAMNVKYFWQMFHNHCVLGAVHILRQPPEGVWQMLTIADEGGRGQKNVQKKEIMGSENVDKENNWHKSNCIS